MKSPFYSTVIQSVVSRFNIYNLPKLLWQARRDKESERGISDVIKRKRTHLTLFKNCSNTETLKTYMSTEPSSSDNYQAIAPKSVESMAWHKKVVNAIRSLLSCPKRSAPFQWLIFSNRSTVFVWLIIVCYMKVIWNQLQQSSLIPWV